ncbi:MAG: amylo-alpha-1,6-glucosidase [Bryobacteraceae bacterium]
MIRFDRQICSNLNESIEREWLETNGIGGYASSTVSGVHTRRYHGLLVAALKPPVARAVLLSKFEETLVVDGRRYDLSANRYPGVVHPDGYRRLKEFRVDPFPVFVYEVDGIEVEKSAFMVHGENTTVIQYALRGAGSRHCELELRPLLAFRGYHSTTHRNSSIDPRVEMEEGVASVSPYDGMPTLHLAHNAVEIRPSGDWYINFEYEIERRRGLDSQEDLFNPLVARFDLTARGIATVIASTLRCHAGDAAALRESEIERRAGVLRACPSDDPFVRDLAAAADHFIVDRGEWKTVIAGYHWFTDWGRDTMIAIPGLTLVTGRPEIAKSILLAFTASLDQGMLPNRFPDAGEAPEYNTVDATLWMFEAVRALVEHTGDYKFVRENLYDPLRGVVEWHVRGTRYGIRVDSDGLLLAAEPGVQLTWMDAKIGDWVVTPRQGKPVEMQALWYNALRVMETLAREFADELGERRYAAMAGKAKGSFERLFWNEEAQCLYDVVDGNHKDGSVRPNQIIAVSLAYTMISPERARAVVSTVQRELLTPYGLRSLSPADPRYRSRYEGDGRSRDSAYHQGTVWPWLLGPFLRAYVKVHGNSDSARSQAAEWIQPLHKYLLNEGCGQIPEVFDGDAPHCAGGCAAQAWSVAEILLAAIGCRKH